ncbi:MAG: CDP-alcohol phosphatidyltransferase family protein [Candidatus Methanoplasma sp.]|jgi:hypothetical protein|nr:CDP-alcohol phosphatidyltransferase family protein [Candidatus Methanoplasma sp.]
MNAEKKKELEEMRRICQPEANLKAAPAADRLVYRKIGFLFTRLLVKTNVTPNQITWFWGLSMIFFSLLFVLKDPIFYVIGAVGWIVSFSLDNTDGEIARFKKLTSKRGLFLDMINHSVTLPTLFFCIGIGVYRTSGYTIDGFYGVLLGFVAGLGMLLVMIAPELYNGVGPEGDLRRGESQGVEGELFGSTGMYIKIRDLNPLTFLNMFIVLLAFAIVNFVFEYFDIGFDLFWMHSLMALFLFGYAVGYAVAFCERVATLYRRL